jgi:hypothetical protein
MHIRRVIMIIAIGNSKVRVGMIVGRIIESHTRKPSTAEPESHSARGKLQG